MTLIEPELKKRIDLIGNILTGTSLISGIFCIFLLVYYPIEILIYISAFFLFIPMIIFVVFCVKIPDFMLPEKFRENKQ